MEKIDRLSLDVLAARLAEKTSVMSNGCKVWTGAVGKGGYGILSYDGVPIAAHRAAMAIKMNDKSLLVRKKGPLFQPRLDYVLHDCDNPPCINPDHLHLGGAKQNRAEAMARNRVSNVACRTGPKLTREEALEVRETGKTWEGLCDMMKKYKIGQGAVMNIVSGRSYKFLDLEMLDRGELPGRYL